MGNKKHNDAAFIHSLQQKRRTNALIEETYKAHLAMALYTLHKDFGFGEKRLGKFIDEFNNTLQCYNGDYVSYSDISKLLEEETGIIIK